jgi:hypothetical protein
VYVNRINTYNKAPTSEDESIRTSLKSRRISALFIFYVHYVRAADINVLSADTFEWSNREKSRTPCRFLNFRLLLSLFEYIQMCQNTTFKVPSLTELNFISSLKIIFSKRNKIDDEKLWISSIECCLDPHAKKYSKYALNIWNFGKLRPETDVSALGRFGARTSVVSALGVTYLL